VIPLTSTFARASLLAVAYLAGAELGSALSLPGSVATFWPPAGIVLAVLLRSEVSAWPWLVVATLPAHLLCDALNGRHPGVGLACWTGSVLQAMVGAWLLRRTVGPRFTLGRVRHVFAFVALAVLASATIAATVGACAAVAAQHAGSFPMLWRMLWMGSAIGVLVAAPLILAWTEPIPEGVSPRGRSEWIAFLAIVAIASGLTLGRQLVPWLAPHLLVVVVVPILSWAAWRLGPRGMGIGLVAIVTLAIKNHLDGVGVLALRNGITPASVLTAQALVSGIVVSFLFVTAGVAEWGALAQALRQADQMKRDFVATVSHELRTPLAAILGYLEMAHDERFAVAQRFAFLDDIERAARQLLELIEATLDVGRLESGRDEPRFEGVSLRAFWQELRSGCATIPRPDGVDLRWSEAVPDLTLVTDRRKLTVVLRNLITNALKFTERGWVGVEAGLEDAAVVFRVRDTGIGIRREEHARIFEMYRQADGSATRRYGGTGLGLHIVSRFLEQLGGTVTLESAPGQGSTFTITVPSTAARRTAA
jgi:signal transduction histidine kinase